LFHNDIDYPLLICGCLENVLFVGFLRKIRVFFLGSPRFTVEKIDSTKRRYFQGKLMLLVMHSAIPIGMDRLRIKLIPSTIAVFIGIEDFFVASFVRNANIIVPVEIRSHIEDEDQAFILVFPFKDVDRLVGVVCHNPRESGRIILSPE
jgi:hypothetical protein